MFSQGRRWLVLAVALGLLAPVPGGAQAGEDFSRMERLKLRRGKLVMRQREERRGQMNLVGGMSWQVVDLPIEVVGRAVKKVSEYEHLLPGVSKFHEVKGKGPFRVIRVCHARRSVEGCYHANIRFANGGRDAFFQLDQSRDNDLRAGWGFVRVSEYGDDKTLFAWGVMADVGRGILAGLMRPHVREWMLKVPTTAKKHLERTYDAT
ncbi:MAG: hypothetical protein ACOCXM_05350 [Myxococcota bacterium]